MSTLGLTQTVLATQLLAAARKDRDNGIKSINLEALGGNGKVESGAVADWIRSIALQLQSPDSLSNDEVRIKNAQAIGWTDIHGGPPNGAYWRGVNPATGRVEEIPELSRGDMICREAAPK